MLPKYLAPCSWYSWLHSDVWVQEDVGGWKFSISMLEDGSFQSQPCCFSTGLSRCKKHNPFPRGLLLSNLLNLQDGKHLLNLQRCRALVAPRASHRWHTLSFTCPRWSCGVMRLPERWSDYRLLLDHCAAGVREGDKRQTVLARLLSAGPTYTHHLHVLLVFKPHKHAHANTNSEPESFLWNQHSNTEGNLSFHTRCNSLPCLCIVPCSNICNCLMFCLWGDPWRCCSRENSTWFHCWVYGTHSSVS